jgi:hypothetical protein
MKDVLVVDDDGEFLSDLSILIDRDDLNISAFTDFDQALGYVVEKVGDIYVCLVDMKPMRTVPDEKRMTDEDRRLLQVPEEICREVQSRGWGDQFYFMSNHRSEYDNTVLQRTGAKFVKKGELSKRLDGILGV